MKTPILLLLLFPISLLSQNSLLPGDANNDGRVDHVDLLAIGLNMGKSGPARSVQGLNWMPMNFFPWIGSLPQTGINAGFSDCDGDGLVTNEDVLAIKMHYDSLQSASFPPPAPYLPFEPAPTTARPKLVFTFDKDTATVKDTLRLSIFYEHPPALPEPASPMGVAFRLEFEESFIKDNLTSITFDDATDLIFAAGATGFADSRAVAPGQVEFSTAGRRAPRLSFTRPLGVVEFIIEDLIVRSDTFWTDFKIDVANVLFLDTLERVFDYEVEIDAVVLFQAVDSFAVCPGDANNDGEVNNQDVLAMGFAYNQEGIPRKPQHQGMDWAAKPYEPWLSNLPATAINLAFSDSDGNGIIDEDDVKAIQLNYDSTHSLAVPASAPYNPSPSDLPVFFEPQLEFKFLKDTVQPGDTLQLAVFYVPPEVSLVEAYPAGIAFALEFDGSLVKNQLTSVSFPVSDELLVAAGASQFALARGVPPGRVEIGVAGKNKLPSLPALSQAQVLCVIEFVLEDALPAGHIGKFNLNVPDLLLINHQEQSMVANVSLDEVFVGANQAQEPLPMRAFPSPVRDILYVTTDEQLLNVQVFDQQGREIVNRMEHFQYQIELGTGNWTPGIYLVKLTARDGRVGLQKVVKH